MTIVGTGTETGTSQIVGMCLINIADPNTILSVCNPPAPNVTPLIINQSLVSRCHLVIKKLS